ncbi:MAG: protoheme IX farnesyltransferase [Armatimonadetes bacterium]|nr:protoheme IX farnesyltransferase [Armatimonadota bacterium]
MKNTTYTWFVWTVLGYSALVLVFGAFVRASYSGDGCGAYWPTCGGGSLIPLVDTAPRAIEFTHRVSSFTLLVLTTLGYFWSRKLFEPRDPVRKATGFAVLSTVVSSLIGALLVLFRWVTDDKSAGRAVTMPLHLVNNYFLIGALSCAAYWSATTYRPARHGSPGAKPIDSALKWLFGSFLVLGATGAFSALGKTAFEHELSFAKGFAERLWLHIGPDAHPFLRGGIVHPLIATSVGILVFWMCSLVSHAHPTDEVKRWSRTVVGLYLLQMALGVLNLVVSAPIPLQLLHLSLAIVNWLSLVMLALATRKEGARETEFEQDSAPAPTQVPVAGGVANEAPRAKPSWKDYVALTKPRVVSLLLFTTIAAMFVAQHGAPPFWMILAVSIGGYAAAGAANAFNMVIERDLDESMARTSHRPTVRHAMTNLQALTFAWTLAVGSFALLWVTTNLLAAVMALCGLLCYVFVYTLWLKRRTWQNIVIGGAAGAFPPLVGYAAVSGTLSPLAWYLFAVIFLWTPVHFWALALLIKDDYAKAGVPMLPVVKGDRVTVNQIGLYTVLTALVSVMPFFQGQAGPTYLVGSVLLNLGLIVQTARLWQHSERPQARALFKYSMVYLALFFIIVAVDQARWM